MLNRLPLSDDHRALMMQLLRYGVTGGFVTVLGVLGYAVAVRFGHFAPLLANILAYLISMGFGYFMHGRYSFQGHGSRDAPVKQGGKFFVTSGISFGLNSLFVWLFTSVFHWDKLSPIIAMIFITPLICFVIYRKWVFV
jgi:putative flippase GtrA